MKKYLLIFFIVIIIIIDLVINKNILNTLIFLTGILSVLKASQNKKSTYTYGLINSFLSSYIFYINNLHMLKILTITIVLPMQILGLLIQSKNNSINKLKNKTERTINILLTIFLISINIILKNNLLTSLDLSSSILDISGLILMLKGYKECWNIWLINNIIDLIIWIILLTLKSQNAFIMILICIIYIVININGIKKWKVIMSYQQ